MLSEIPLSRLLEGIAASLRHHVEPGLTDEFARMQLRAIDEVLRNLAGRVEWATEGLNAEIVELSAVLRRLAEEGWPGSPPEDDASPATNAEALANRTAVTARLVEALRWTQTEGSDEARATATAYLRDVNSRERAGLKSGMYS